MNHLLVGRGWSAYLPGARRWVNWGARLLAVLFLLAGVSDASAAVLVRRNLSGSMVAGGDVSMVWNITPDGRYVIFIADRNTDEKLELYRVPARGGEPVAISGALGANTDVMGMLVTPDSQYVVFITQEAGQPHPTGLWSVRMDATTPVRLNGVMLPGAYIDRFKVSPQAASAGMQVAYTVKTVLSDTEALYAVPAGGGSPVSLYTASCEFCSIGLYMISPDSQRVVFKHTVDVGATSLGIATVSGSSLVEGEVGNPISFRFFPDNLRLLLAAEGGLYVVNLLTGDIVGEALTRDLGYDAIYDITPNGSRVVFVNASDGLLMAAVVETGATISLSGSMDDDFATGVTDFAISNDGQTVVYVADQYTRDVFELFAAPVFGGEDPTRLSGDMTTGGDIISFRIAPNSLGVAYLADQVTDGKEELFVWSAPPGYSYKVSGAITPAQGDVAVYLILPNSQGVVFTADKEVDGRDELYFWSALNGSVTKLNEALPAGATVQDFMITRDSQRVVYRADQETLGKLELWQAFYAELGYTPLVNR